jgi:uncharacterized protein YndB with AHSA1/START domain
VHHLDAKVGGTYKMSFTNFSSGKSHSFGGKYIELVENKSIRYSDQFDDPNMPGEMITTVNIKQVSCGSDVTNAIPAELCYLGWQESIEQLVKLVEPEIPD